MKVFCIIKSVSESDTFVLACRTVFPVPIAFPTVVIDK